MLLTDKVLADIAGHVPTPFFAYDQSAMKATFQGLKRYLPEGSDIYYSLKANPNKAVVRTLTEEGAGCEVCSRAELETAVAAGGNPRRIIYVGPAKSERDIERAMDLGIKAIIAESRAELELIGSIAARRCAVQPVGLRINPDFKSASVRIKMTGVASQFGIDEAELWDVLDMVEAHASLIPVGIHVYLGSRILEEEAVFANTRNILELAERVSAHLGRPLSFVDVGGGFGLAYFPKERDLDPVRLGGGLADLIAEFRARHRRTRVLIELGRYLVAASGVLVTSVRYVKQSKGKTFAVCDGGSNIFAAAAGYGSAFRKNWPVRRLGACDGDMTEQMLTGPLCTPSDTTGDKVMLPRLKPGDLLCFERAGAYGPSASPTRFLSFGHPAEVMLTPAGAVLVREADPADQEIPHQVWRPLPRDTGMAQDDTGVLAHAC
ncbi:diaminopimelate decarboxylase [Defluviimonas denitrificans]|jgi:diaminopimelate decarboxylase|uniref:Diaminopimelate decarboxylase n=1 Tax=Albidovulum denitrificans TaxID=404881 RepID=A0A2S8S5F9_9RHOB|nr:alanine racemase [Defluviimonas denitrificans]PQV56049.1 diaminopimelate decarboxylase [Defluviimonas denitrificans]